jgi:sugar phosphate isomerase/epimerase
MLTRRNFLQVSAAAALPMFVRPLWTQAHSQTHLPIGLQLSTLVKHKVDEAELSDNLRQIAAIGFQEVEPWHAAYSIPADQLRKMITGSGLAVASGHFEYADLTADLTGQLNYAKTLGLKWVVCPMLPKSQWTSADGFHTAARQFNEWAKRVRDMGMRFAFHNHDYEFREFNGMTGYDIMLNETDPNLVFYEMDCYWITQAGLDPVQMLNRLGRRVRMLHVKDRKPGFPPSLDMNDSSAHFTEVGTGSINWPAILATAEKLQIEHYFIEQDRIDGPPIESLRRSYNYLRKILP